MDQTYFTIEQCEDGGLYYLQAFHFRLGVYIEEVQGLVGIRRKLGISYLFIEYHFDYSVVIGTAQPITLLGDCPDAILRSYTGSRDDQHRELIRFLGEAEARYGNDH